MGNFLRNLDPNVIGREAKLKVLANHHDYGDKYSGQSIQDVLVKELQNNKNFDELLKEHEGQRDERVEDDETLGTHLMQRSKKRGGQISEKDKKAIEELFRPIDHKNTWLINSRLEDQRPQGRTS